MREVMRMRASHADEIESWKCIATALGVGEGTALRYAKRAHDPLPVEYNHKRRVVITIADLDAWHARNPRKRRSAQAR
jgi:hypothetical protein